MDYVIPVLKEILAINPKVKIIGSPWTCPRWMKVKDLKNKMPYDSWTDGHINPEYSDYSMYFVKWIQAFEKEGIKIYAVTPQNEPLNHGNCASTYLPWNEEADFVKVMAACFKRNKLDTKIYVFDHNYNCDNTVVSKTIILLMFITLWEILKDLNIFVGAAYHNYSGSNQELDDIHQKRQTKINIFGGFYWYLE